MNLSPMKLLALQIAKRDGYVTQWQLKAEFYGDKAHLGDSRHSFGRTSASYKAIYYLRDKGLIELKGRPVESRLWSHDHYFLTEAGNAELKNNVKP